MNSSERQLRVPLRITGSKGAACSSNFSVGASLKHRSDAIPLSFDEHARTDTIPIYAALLQPGRYTLSGRYCSAYSPDYSDSYSCAVGAASSTIKYAARLRVTANRLTGSARQKVRFTARVARYYADAEGARPITTKVAIQLYRGHGRWRTVHVGTARGRAGYTWTYNHKQTARYRAVSYETSAVFGRTSPTLRR